MRRFLTIILLAFILAMPGNLQGEVQDEKAIPCKPGKPCLPTETKDDVSWNS